jgi:ORF6N domain
MAKPQAAVIPVERIANRIYLIRGEKIMLDSDLAELYGVETRTLVQAVKRNNDRFPDDFMFQFSEEELENWRSQIVMSNPAAKMGLRRRPYAFTELGVAMLSTVLRSKSAIQVNVAIMRTFVRLRELLATHRDVARKVEEHDRQIAALFSAVQKLLTSPDPPKKYPIGYVPAKDD